MTICNFFREVRSKFLGEKSSSKKITTTAAATITSTVQVQVPSSSSTTTTIRQRNDSIIDNNNNNDDDQDQDDDHHHNHTNQVNDFDKTLQHHSGSSLSNIHDPFVIIHSNSKKNLEPNRTNQQQQPCLPRRYYSLDVNQRKNKLNLDLSINNNSRSSSISSKKSLIMEKLEINGSPFFANSWSNSSNSIGQSRSPPIISHFDLNGKEISRNNSSITIDGINYSNVTELDFRKISELGSGNFGYVQKCLHLKSGLNLAIKRMKFNDIDFEDVHRHIFKDLELLSKSHHEHIVKFLGYVLTENQSELWLCMELMDTCFDRLIKHLKLNHNETIPEDIIGSVTISIIDALVYLKQQHNVIHRDIKPSNILINHCGYIKLCDFGISGCLVDSKTSSQTMGSVGYQAPERLNPINNVDGDGVYDSRVDIWSLGLTLLEMALGYFPYQNWSGTFGIITKILNKQDVPSLPKSNKNYSKDLRDFIQDCLQYDYRRRPKYEKLKLKKFFIKHKEKFNIQLIKQWLESIYI